MAEGLTDIISLQIRERIIGSTACKFTIKFLYLPNIFTTFFEEIFVQKKMCLKVRHIPMFSSSVASQEGS